MQRFTLSRNATPQDTAGPLNDGQVLGLSRVRSPAPDDLLSTA